MKKKFNLYLGDKLIAKDVEGCDISFDETDKSLFNKDSTGWNKVVNGLRDNIQPFKTSSSLYNLTYDEVKNFPSMQEEVMNKMVKEMTSKFDEILIEIIRELNLCEKGEEIAFMNDNHCFRENHSYWLRCDKGLFHLLKIKPMEINFKDNINSDTSTIYGSMMIEKIGKKLN